MYPQNPYMAQNPYLQPMYQQQTPAIPPQQIITAKGKPSIDTLKMSPNSSVLIADETQPIIWKCVSDGLGNVSAEAWDITPHKDEAQKEQENMLITINQLNERLTRLEANYEQSTTRRNGADSTPSKHAANQANMGNSKKYGKSTGNDEEPLE